MRPHLLEGRKREERVGELGNVACHKRGLTDWREEAGRAGPGLDMAIFPEYVSPPAFPTRKYVPTLHSPTWMWSRMEKIVAGFSASQVPVPAVFQGVNEI